MKSRYETMRELEEVKKTRFEAKADDLDFNEVFSIIIYSIYTLPFNSF